MMFPLFGIVSRLTRQKGFDVVVEELHQLLQRIFRLSCSVQEILDLKMPLLGFGQAYPDKLSANITFDVQLAQEIYAASDVFLMPSRFEPCGLSPNDGHALWYPSFGA